MALAYRGFDELNHQLRFMLFEIGLGLSQTAMDRHINLAHRNTMQRLQQAAFAERLINRPIDSHHVHDFVDQLQQRLKSGARHLFSRWERLQDELDESIANEAMALAWRERWQAQLAKQACRHARFWDWLQTEQSAAEQLLFLEQWGCTGHPTHPNFRAKMGFSRREVLQYSPEFQAQVSIHWCALRRSSAFVTAGYRDHLFTRFPLEAQRWCDALMLQHLNPDDYEPIPVHPWQWRNQLQKSLCGLVERKGIVLIPHHQIVHPGMSFRTMIPADLTSSHIKLATAIHTTSATRTVSPSSVYNGPNLTAWLQAILREQDHYDGTLFLAGDVAGIHLTDSDYPVIGQKQMAAIIRENPLQSLRSGQVLVPLAALFAASPLSGKPLLFDIINASQREPEWYFHRYCRIVFQAQLALMLQHGIALEAHQQNTLLVFEDNLPRALVLRDLGGICFSQHDVWQSGQRPVLHPDATIGSRRLADLGNTFVHGNLGSNIEYWINAMSRYYPLAERTLWGIAHQCLTDAFQTLRPRVDASAWSELRDHVLTRPWLRKCFLSMRLSPTGKQEERMPRANPLSLFDE